MNRFLPPPVAPPRTAADAAAAHREMAKLQFENAVGVTLYLVVLLAIGWLIVASRKRWLPYLAQMVGEVAHTSDVAVAKSKATAAWFKAAADAGRAKASEQAA